jgi:flavin-binding protein dodecin
MTTVKIVELVGASPVSWHDAVKEAVKEASKTIRNIQGVDVINQTAIIDADTVKEYRVNLKLSFKVEDERTQ